MAALEDFGASEQLVGSAQSKEAAEDLLRRATAPEGSVEPMPRAMVVVAHPDDETIALGARMGRFQEAHFVHITDGAPRNEQDSRAHGFSRLDDYRQARAHELAEMFTRARLQRVSRGSLGFRDQEATLNLVEITRQLVQRISHHEPEVIFTHPYEGGHPDHDASAFAVHHAVELHRTQGGKRPLILEAPFYNAGPQGFGSGRFLEAQGNMPEVRYELSPEERERKHALVACFTTQQETLKGFHDATERYRIAPVYDFTRPPHEGRVLYDHYPWGMTSERFCELAEDAENRLREGMDTT
jgi:N-acetylglucosamine malate deacetylase 2